MPLWKVFPSSSAGETETAELGWIAEDMQNY